MITEALCAFNVFNVESARAVAEAATALSTRVFMQTSPSVVNLYGAKRLYRLFSLLMEDLDSSLISIHLDHCTDLELVSSCINSGWNSVMIDGSSYALEENIQVTKKVVGEAHRAGVRVEGELGTIGGEEDGVQYSGRRYVKSEEVPLFVEETGVDMLAVGIGNKHGYYESGSYKLDFDLLGKIHGLVPDLPLVLHGGTGIPPEDIRRAVALGVRKINFSTELKDCFLASITKHAEGKERHNMVAYHRTAVAAIKNYAMGKISLVSGENT